MVDSILQELEQEAAHSRLAFSPEVDRKKDLDPNLTSDRSFLLPNSSIRLEPAPEPW